MMNAEDVTVARVKLGEMWTEDGRMLSASELARALGLSPRHGSDHVRNMESGKSAVSGPIAYLLTLYLRGERPPEGVEVLLPQVDRQALAANARAARRRQLEEASA